MRAMLTDATERVNLVRPQERGGSGFSEHDGEKNCAQEFVRHHSAAYVTLTRELPSALLLPGFQFPMKTAFRCLAVVFVLIAVNFARAGDFVSQVVQAGASFTITVPSDRFLVIRNFTQEGPTGAITVRGTVSATDRTGLSGTLLTATIIDPDPTLYLEPIDDVVIAGPSTVTVTAGNTNCFITYRKGQD
jgi:hypothetical protein